MYLHFAKRQSLQILLGHVDTAHLAIQHVARNVLDLQMCQSRKRQTSKGRRVMSHGNPHKP